MPSLVVSYSHTDEDIDLTVAAIDGALEAYRQALDGGVERYLIGRPSQPVYRRYNRPEKPDRARSRREARDGAGQTSARAKGRISARPGGSA